MSPYYIAVDLEGLFKKLETILQIEQFSKLIC